MSKREPVTVRVVSVVMADGSDINSPEAQQRIARALLSGVTHPTVTGQKPVQQPAKAG